jgi:hypothetical protein
VRRGTCGSSRWLGWLAALAASGCRATSPVAPAPTWLATDRDEQIVQLERQLRGFDVAMLETGHRYVELYWAGRDGNWEAAAYQVEKIRLAIENGLERRPKRAASAADFLNGPLASLQQAVASRSRARFDPAFEALTAGCNACHAREGVPFFAVRAPETRVSPIRRVGGESVDR